nr:MAG TPA: hypothetical protein [Caudoviricetes sp.]
MNDFIETTEVFLRNLNQSMIERDQFNDCLEILLDKVMDYQTSGRGVDKAFGQIISLTETLLRSSTNRQAIDEDTIMVYEQRRLKTFKNKFLEEGSDEV